MFSLFRKPTQRRPSEAEKAQALYNSHSAVWAFLIANNPANINDTLRNMLGFTLLPYEPDPVKIGHAIGKLIEAKEKSKLQLIINEFEFLPGTTLSKEVKDALHYKLTTV